MLIKPKSTLGPGLICQHEVTWVVLCHGDSYTYTVNGQRYLCEWKVLTVPELLQEPHGNEGPDS